MLNFRFFLRNVVTGVACLAVSRRNFLVFSIFAAVALMMAACVEDVAVTGVSLNESAITLDVAETVTLTATFQPADATNRAVVWTTSNPLVALVVNGAVTGVETGTAVITVTTVDGAHTATCNVTVRSSVERLTGPITTNRTLGIPHGTKEYLYDSDFNLEVENAAVLTILPGTTIRFSRTDGGIRVTGGATIVAEGLPKLLDAGGAPITVGGVELDGRIRFVGGATKGSWAGIEFSNTNAVVKLKYVDIINAGSSTAAHNHMAALMLYETRAEISHCLISGGLVHGISMWDNGNIMVFNNNKVENVNGAPVFMRGTLAKLEKFDMTSDFTNNTNKYVQVILPQFSRADVTINKTSVPYYFTSDMSLEDSKRLTINEGVTIYMGNNTYIRDSYGNGALTINGAVENPVLFTRLPGAAYYWEYISLEGGTGHVINNCIFEYGGGSSDGGNGYDCMLRIDGAQLTMNNVQFNNSYGYGIILADFYGAIRLTHNNVTFKDNFKGNVRDRRSDPHQTLNELP